MKSTFLVDREIRSQDLNLIKFSQMKEHLLSWKRIKITINDRENWLTFVVDQLEIKKGNRPTLIKLKRVGFVIDLYDNVEDKDSEESIEEKKDINLITLSLKDNLFILLEKATKR